MGSNLSSSTAAVTSTVSTNANLRSMAMAASSSPHLTVRAVASLPPLLYGTAWKKERTQELVELAVRQGFRGIDTACQPKHYYEPGVGLALQNLFREGVVTRDQIFLQTKFTPFRGQDPDNIPYDPKTSLHDQVWKSFQTSLKNLQTDYVDSLVLHSPMADFSATSKVWRSFEEIYDAGGALNLGISNCYDIGTLQALYNIARIKPRFIQNRFYQQSGYDKEIRKFCRQNNIVYQSFWTLTANPHILKSATVGDLSQKYGKTPEQIFFRFVHAQGIVYLSGTKNDRHMREDLDVPSFQLEPSEIDSINALL